MKKKALIIGFLIAILCVGMSNEAGAQRWGHRRGYGYYRPRIWVAPPPPRVIVAPRYGYYRPHYYRPRYYARPRYYGYNRPYHRRW